MITPPTPDAVRAINGSSLADAAIQPFIDAALCIALSVQACAVGAGVSDECLTTATAFIACHLLSGVGVGGSASKVKSKESFENWSVEYISGQYSSSGVLSTSYGNIANSMLGGCLQEVDKRKPSLFFFGGA